MVTKKNRSKKKTKSLKDEYEKLNDSEKKGVNKLLDMLLTLRQQRTLRNSFEKEQERNEE